MQKVLASSHAGGQFDVTMQYYRPCSVGLSDDFPERLYYLLSEGADYLQLPLSKISPRTRLWAYGGRAAWPRLLFVDPESRQARAGIPKRSLGNDLSTGGFLAVGLSTSPQRFLDAQPGGTLGLRLRSFSSF